MKSDNSALLKKAGFVYFRGKWIPRLPGKAMLWIMTAKFAACNNREIHLMLAELAAALYEHNTATNK